MWLLLVCGMGSVACADGDGAGRLEPSAAEAAITVRALAPGADTLLSGLTVTVSGRGIPEPLVFDLASAGNQVGGTVTVPAGPERVFAVKGFMGAIQTHAGADTADVLPGPGAIDVVLEKRVGAVVRVSATDYDVRVLAASAEVTQITLLAGSTTTFNADVRYAGAAADGSHARHDPVDGVPVSWSLTDQGTASLDRASCVTGESGIPGQCTVSVSIPLSLTGGSSFLLLSYAGVSHAVKITTSTT